jgi:hypothetical protein
MNGVLEVVTVVLVAFTMAPALAHALELPGKMRLSKEEYRVVQRIRGSPWLASASQWH